MKKGIFVICNLCSIFCWAQNVKTLDLSKKGSSESVNPQTISGLVLVNGLAKAGTIYTVDISVKHVFQTALSIPNATPVAPSGIVGIAGCTTLETAITKLENELKEDQIPKDIEDVQKEMKNAAAACDPDKEAAQEDINLTTIHYPLPIPVTIGKNDELDITIVRGDNKWVFVFKNQQPNHWTTFYGFTYVPDVLTKFPNYYANQQTAGGYIISKMNGGNKNVLQNASPTAMFTYRFFDKKPDAVVKFGLTAGIFYNTDILGAMAGPSLVIGDNVTLNTGISFIQKHKLKGQYKDGQTIQDNLDFDQLHEKIWSYDVFISIGLNIPEMFSKKSNSTPSTSESTPGK